MKKEQIKIGQVYTAKVSDKLVPVRIEKEHAGGGWDATNLKTNRPVRIKSAQQLRNALSHQDEPATAAETTPANPVKAPRQESKPTPTPAVPKPTKTKKVSGLDAAAQVLKDAGEPMGCKVIVQTMLDKGMWSTGGATPHATIYAAILREIKTKGSEARFKKTDRGLFALNA